MARALKKYVLQNRDLATFIGVGGASLFGGGCDVASGALDGTALLLQIIASAL